MDIETIISIDTDNLASELEDQIREIAEDQITQNYNSFQDDDDVNGLIDNALTEAEILDADDVQQLINESMQDVADNTDTVNEITTEYRDLRLECQDMRNEVEKLRRSMRILLEEREGSIKKRMARAYGAGTRALTSMARKVHWHMPRR